MTKKQAVVVRTYSAGVHYGYLVSQKGKEVTLERSRRIWSWKGANSLSEIATSGVGPGSKIAVPVSIVLTEAVEIITCTAAAAKNLDGATWA